MSLIELSCPATIAKRDELETQEPLLLRIPLGVTAQPRRIRTFAVLQKRLADILEPPDLSGL